MPKMYLMNTTMMPNNFGTYVADSDGSARGINQLIDAGDYEVVSAIGHDSAAEAMTAVLGRKVCMNRMTVTLEDGDAMCCLKLKSRLPEGAVIDLATMEQIGFDLVLIRYSVDVD